MRSCGPGRTKLVRLGSVVGSEVMGHIIVQLALYFVVPGLAIYGCSRSKVLDALSPVVLCYAVGIALANQPWLVMDGDLAQTVSGVVVLLAIGILLMPVDYRAWIRLARVTILSCVLCVLSVVLVSVVVVTLFAGSLSESWKVAGMLVGVYTGGTANMAAIGTALHVEPQTFITVHTSDVVVGGIYYLFIVSLAGRIFGLVLRPFQSTGAVAEPDEESRSRSSRMGRTALVLFFGALLVGAGAGLMQLVPEGSGEAVAVLTVTTLAIALSFVQKVRAIAAGSGAGDYLLYVFCVAVGSLANLEKLAEAPVEVFLLTTVVVVGSAAVHLLLCRVLRVDRDTAIITSTAALYGPAFVGPVAKSLKNREIVVSGITAGLAGLAVGNYLGLGVAYFVRTLLGSPS